MQVHLSANESGVLEDLEHLFAGNLLGHPIEYGHLLIGEPGLARQSGSDLGVLVLVVGPLGRVGGLEARVVDERGMGQRAVRLLLIFMDGRSIEGLTGIWDRGANVLGRNGTDHGQRYEEVAGVHLQKKGVE